MLTRKTNRDFTTPKALILAGLLAVAALIGNSPMTDRGFVENVRSLQAAPLENTLWEAVVVCHDHACQTVVGVKI